MQSLVFNKDPNCSDPRNSDTDFGGFTMSKLSKGDKLNIYREWTIHNKRAVYLSKKYGITEHNFWYLVSLIDKHGLNILDKSYVHYSN